MARELTTEERDLANDMIERSRAAMGSQILLTIP